jgi:Leucine-rich repeat (LRR) protein
VRHIGKQSLTLMLVLCILFGILCRGHAALEQTDSDGLGAFVACEGHTLGMFNGVSACINAEGELHICENNVPDDVFRNYLWQRNGSNDQYFSQEEAEIARIYVSGGKIASLRGIEFFTALVELICSGNTLTELDLSNNTAMTTLRCEYNQLEKLEVRACTELYYLDCSNNKLRNLNVSGCTKLTTLQCEDNWLMDLDVSNTTLDYLNCARNQLTKLNVSSNKALTLLQCYSNQLMEVDVSGCTALTTLYCYNNQLTELDVKDCIALDDLDCSYNQLKKLDVSGCTALTYLECGYNQLVELNASRNAALMILSCENNQLTKLDTSSNTALNELYIGYNQMVELDVGNNASLMTLHCYNNLLTKLDVSNNTELMDLYCDNNQLTELHVASNTALASLSCAGNYLTELDMSCNTALVVTDISGQTRKLTIESSEGGKAVDLGKLISPNNFNKIINISVGEWNPQTGIVTIPYEAPFFTYTYDTGNSSYPMEVTVYVVSCTITINGESFVYAPGQEIPLAALDFYTSNGWGYRFAGWSGDIDTVADITSSSTTVTIPEQDITLQAEYILIGDINGDGDISPADAVQIVRMSAQNIPEKVAGDIDGDGMVTSADVVYMKRYLVGNFIPSK